MAKLGEDPEKSAAAKVTAMAKKWQAQVDSADKAYKRWEADYKCDQLEGYYAGIDQWEDPSNHENYTINMCHPNMQQRLPSLYFNRPKFRIKPRPSRADDPFTLIEERTKLREDTLNTFLDNPAVGFVAQTKLAVKEAHYRYGVIEVGYDNDAIENPNKGKPSLDENGKEMFNSKGEKVMQGEFIDPTTESMWVRRIPAKTFRCSVNSNNELHRNEWVGYYEYEYVGDIQANRAYANTDRIEKGTSKMRRDMDTPVEGDEADLEEYKKRQGMIKVWKIWSLREKKRYVWPDGKKFFFIGGEAFKTLPLAHFTFYPIMDELYGLPVLTNWISPQDELNETRTMLRVHRRRALRRYAVLEGKLPDEEIEKFKNGGDMTIIKVPVHDVLKPIEDAALDRAVLANIPMTREDMMYVAETSAEQLGQEQSETATAATISDTNARIRITDARETVSKFLADVCYIMLRIAEEKMVLPTWVMKNVDPLSPMAMVEAARVAGNWKQIQMAKDFGDLDYEVVVDVQTLSPVTEDVDRARLEKMITVIANPGVAILLGSSDALLKRFMNVNGIRGDAEIREIQTAMQLMGTLMAAAPGTKGGKPGESSDPGKPTPPETTAATGPSSLASQMGATQSM